MILQGKSYQFLGYKALECRLFCKKEKLTKICQSKCSAVHVLLFKIICMMINFAKLSNDVSYKYISYPHSPSNIANFATYYSHMYYISYENHMIITCVSYVYQCHFLN